jgi:hypothetical protein
VKKLKKCLTDVMVIVLMAMGVVYICDNKDKLMNKIKKPINNMLNNN